MDENRFDKEIRYAAQKYGVPYLLLKAQVWQESRFDPHAVSSCGARGLLQLMPGTAREMRVDTHEIEDPEINLDAGANYLRIQYDHFPEITDPVERWKFALASYNGGRGHINVAYRVARLQYPKPGELEQWSFVSRFLAGCDEKQIRDYVEKIWAKWNEYQKGAKS